METPWRIEMLGGLRAIQGDQEVTRFRTQKTGALLAYLACFPQRTHLRDDLIELLWPDSDLHAARNCLSRELSALREKLEPSGVPAGSVLITNRASIRLNPGAVTTDIAEFERSLHAARSAQNRTEQARSLACALDLYHGELLAGYYENWILEQREWLAEAYFHALSQLVTILEEGGDPPRALEYARQGVLADRLREEARRDLMRLYAASGQPAAALWQYRELERLLKEELAAEPSALTRALACQIEEDPDAFLAAPRSSFVQARPASPEGDAPSGTMTFLLTDVAGSAHLWEEHPQAMAAALARHDALAAAILSQHAGTLVKHRAEGDRLFVVFAGATDAVAAALALQRALWVERWPEEISLRVRMALHTGDAVARDGDYLGPTVNRCARLRAIAHGGQVLLSRTTQELVERQLPEGASLRDLGEHRLKDLTRPEQVCQLLHPDLPADFPPLHTLETHPNNLPAPPTPLIGREVELEAARCLLLREEVRLVTLTGAGGSGKTRLGQQVAADLLADFADGVFFVALAPIRDPDLVAPTIAEALGVREVQGRRLRECLGEALRAKQLLLLLDNFEQLLPAGAPLVAELLAAAPRVKVLVTSRAVLRLRGEHDFPVPPLALPDRRRLPAEELLSRYAAVALFFQRAHAARPDVAVTDESALVAAEICRRLDGLPLAIELAAARIRILSPEALLARLERRLPLLTGGARDLPERQQTLRAAIGWSYDLLREDEQRMFRRLSVFVGGCSLDALEAVCSAPGDLQIDVFEGVGSLVEQSLLRQKEPERGESSAPSDTGQVREPRFEMLETVREYAQEQLEASEETAVIRRQHAQFFLALAQAAESERRSSGQGERLDRLDREHDNLRTALRWSVECHEPQIGMQLAIALREFWTWRGYWTEIREWCETLLSLEQTASPTLARASLLEGAGAIAHLQGDVPAARAWLEESVTVCRAVGDTRTLIWVLHSLGSLAEGRGDYASARAHLEEAVALNRAFADKRLLSQMLNDLGLMALRQGDVGTARTMVEESLALAREMGDKIRVAWGLLRLGHVAEAEFEWEAARTLYEQSLAVARETLQKLAIGWALAHLGRLAHWHGDDPAAGPVLKESLAIMRGLGNKIGLAVGLEASAGRAVAQGQAERGTRLLGAADAARVAADCPLQPDEREHRDHTIAQARAILGEERFAAAWAAGRAMSLEQVFAEAMAEPAPEGT